MPSRKSAASPHQLAEHIQLWEHACTDGWILYRTDPGTSDAQTYKSVSSLYKNTSPIEGIRRLLFEFWIRRVVSGLNLVMSFKTSPQFYHKINSSWAIVRSVYWNVSTRGIRNSFFFESAKTVCTKWWHISDLGGMGHCICTAGYSKGGASNIPGYVSAILEPSCCDMQWPYPQVTYVPPILCKQFCRLKKNYSLFLL